MKTFARGRGLVLAICAALLAIGTTAGAATDEGKCRDTILKEAGKYLKAQTKNLGKCNDSLVKAKTGFNGLQGRDCRDLAGKTQEKLDKARNKFLAKVDKKCGGDDKICGNNADTAGLALLADDLDIDDPAIGWGASGNFGNGFAGICPDFESAGCTNTIRHCGGAGSDGEGITDCVLCINDQVINQTMDLLYADLLSAKFGAGIDPVKSHNKCQKAMVKASAKHVLSKSKTLGKCWAAVNKGKAGFSSSDGAGCIDTSGKTAAKIDKSEAKKIAAICKACGGDDKACDQNLSTLAGTLVNTAGSGGDFDPLLDIGFGEACPNLTLPYAPGTDCGTLDNLGSGSLDDNIENMEEFVRCLDCVLEYKVDCADRSLVPNQEAMPAECSNSCILDVGTDLCPTSLQVTVNPFDTRLDSGWTGTSHDFDVPSNGRLTLGMSNCDGTNRPTCGECDLTGPLPNTGGDQFDTQRCRGDSSITCTADSDCGANAPCSFFFGAMLPLTSGSVPICVTNEIVGAVTGTANVESGTAATAITLFTKVHIGAANAKPCPTCEFDDVDNQFECGAGARAGLLCTVDSQSSFFGQLSYDCPPDGVIGEFNIGLNPATGLQTATLSTANPSCTGSGFSTSRCFCSTCQASAIEPCMTDADCAATRTCGGKRCLDGVNQGDPCTGTSDCAGGPCDVPGQGTQPHKCVGDFVCTPNPGDTDSVDEGFCALGPFDGVCSLEPYLGCFNDAGCAGGGKLPGQTCIFPVLNCYTDNGVIGGTVDVQGAADPGCGNRATPALGTLFCVPPSEGAAVNAVAGLPGLARLDLKVEAIYE